MSDFEVNKYNIVVLGAPASGKTVYMATLHHLITGDGLGDGIFFKTAGSSAMKIRDELNSLYGEIVERDKPWPVATPSNEDLREWEFTCGVRVSRRSGLFGRLPKPKVFDLFNLTYIDYAGEWISSARNVDEYYLLPFGKRVEEADALLGIIDGLQILKCLEGAQSDREFFRNQLIPILGVMTDNDRGRPIHFIVTKWDLLESYGVDKVKALLLDGSCKEFRDLIESRTVYSRMRKKPHGVIRLIPVSSLGNFAVLGANYVIDKSVDHDPAPINVEVPLVAVLGDIVEQRRNELLHWRKKVPGDSRGDGGSEHRPSVMYSDKGLSLDVVMIASSVVDGVFDLGSQAGRGVQNALLRMRSEYRKVSSRGKRAVKDEETALLYAMRAFRARFKKYEKDQVNGGLILWAEESRQ